MSFMKGWKLKTPSMPNSHSSVAALNPSRVQAAITPENTHVNEVKPIDNQMSKFRGLKRTLAKDRNIFKESKD